MINVTNIDKVPLGSQFLRMSTNNLRTAGGGKEHIDPPTLFSTLFSVSITKDKNDKAYEQHMRLGIWRHAYPYQT